MHPVSFIPWYQVSLSPSHASVKQNFYKRDLKKLDGRVTRWQRENLTRMFLIPCSNQEISIGLSFLLRCYIFRRDLFDGYLGKAPYSCNSIALALFVAHRGHSVSTAARTSHTSNAISVCEHLHMSCILY